MYAAATEGGYSGLFQASVRKGETRDFFEAHDQSKRNQNGPTRVARRHIFMPVVCTHCQQKLRVKMRARSEFLAMYPQSVKCLKCDQVFDVTIPDEIIGEPIEA